MFSWKWTSEYWLCSSSGKGNTVMLLQNLLERRLRQTVRCTKCVNFDTKNHSLLPVSYQKSTLETPATDQMSCSIKALLYPISLLQMGEKMKVMETRRHFYKWALLCTQCTRSFPFTTSFFTPFLSESIWNAASFYQESSYLYFPTLQAELASDISLYFKTSAPSGVFLENLGLKDFIRVELSCESTFRAK